MTIYTPPVRDLGFVLHEALKVQELNEISGYEDLSPDFTGAVLEEAGKLARDVLAPINQIGDVQGCMLENGVVRTPDGFKEAFDLMREGGWPSMDCDPEHGGQGMPAVLTMMVGLMHSAANLAFAMYPGLTHGVYSALKSAGSEEQKATYLPKLASAEWGGTMNLTEPHCGTDLGMLRTRAEPQDDGTYKISGEKIFISSGEHDMCENIIHLVLARIPGGPAGTKGISLFIVPKFLVNEDGSLGQRNGVSCGKLEKKMGIHGNATCVMNYDEATGFLVGAEHAGLRAMFVMMNEARMGVGLQGLGVASIAYENAVIYARERLQGRAVTGAENPDGPADPLIVHPDVRRLLMDQKAFVEGGYGFLAWVAMLMDAERHHEDEEQREKAGNLVSLLTPIVKGFLTEEGYRLTAQAQQVFGGHGYIEETGMSQFVRDARITMIYEGTTGVQALDLVGRKLGLHGGKPIMAFFEYIKGYIKDNEHDLTLARDFLEPLKAASKDLQQAAMFFMQAGMKDPNAALAGSVDFLHLFGHVCMGLSWTRQAKAASKALQEGAPDQDYYINKLTTGRYYMARILPETSLRLTRIQTGAAPVMDLPAEAF
ncbi:acyl-CoA dehydrogenase C-terminal domain-containing protein [Rhodobacteraceae bacterium NNCM2]|nr:acyl-CoA dehydrogenase C-terminal domain-containing protein [Coraliihabitans acroporae]